MGKPDCRFSNFRLFVCELSVNSKTSRYYLPNHNVLLIVCNKEMWVSGQYIANRISTQIKHSSSNEKISSRGIQKIFFILYRGYYTAVRRCEFYLRVVKTIFHE